MRDIPIPRFLERLYSNLVDAIDKSAQLMVATEDYQRKAALELHVISHHRHPVFLQVLQRLRHQPGSAITANQRIEASPSPALNHPVDPVKIALHLRAGCLNSRHLADNTGADYAEIIKD